MLEIIETALDVGMLIAGVAAVVSTRVQMPAARRSAPRGPRDAEGVASRRPCVCGVRRIGPARSG